MSFQGAEKWILLHGEKYAQIHFFSAFETHQPIAKIEETREIFEVVKFYVDFEFNVRNERTLPILKLFYTNNYCIFRIYERPPIPFRYKNDNGQFFEGLKDVVYLLFCEPNILYA